MKEIFESLEISFEPFIRYLLSIRFWVSVVFVLVGIVLYKKISKSTQNIKSDSGKFNKFLIANKLKYVILPVWAVFILQINGVNVSAIISSFGIIGIVIGFALQDELKDWIMGTDISRKHFFAIGDTVLYNGICGVVIGFDLKCTVIQEVGLGDTLYISNRNISEITRLSDRCDIDVPSPYDVPAEKMRRVCSEISDRAKCVEYVHSSEFIGTEAFDESLIRYRIRIRCVEKEKDTVRRTVNGIIQDVFAEEGIAVPFNQLDVNIKK